MNPMPDGLASVAEPLALEALLAPLSANTPCGPAARYDPVFTEVRLLREEDDPSLPMGQWERPLKRADWRQIERCCTDMLATRSKDLQIAMWLLESWMRQRGFVGLVQGLRLLDALLRRYWQPLHPVIDDDGDADARLASLEWLNESVSASVKLHAVLVFLKGDKTTSITLADWERLTARGEVATSHADRKIAAGTATRELTRVDIQSAAHQMGPALATTTAAIGDSLDTLRSVSSFLQQQLQAESPKLVKLQHVLEAAMRVLVQLHPEEKAAAQMSINPPQEMPRDDDGGELAPLGGLGDIASPAGVAVLAHWRNRDEAYATLEALASYLSQAEPHSPTPFLLRRAANWGRMTLPEVIAEIIREDGDVTRFIQMLGTKISI